MVHLEWLKIAQTHTRMGARTFNVWWHLQHTSTYFFLFHTHSLTTIKILGSTTTKKNWRRKETKLLSRFWFRNVKKWGDFWTSMAMMMILLTTIWNIEKKKKTQTHSITKISRIDTITVRKLKKKMKLFLLFYRYRQCSFSSLFLLVFVYMVSVFVCVHFCVWYTLELELLSFIISIEILFTHWLVVMMVLLVAVHFFFFTLICQCSSNFNWIILIDYSRLRFFLLRVDVY